MPCDAVYTINLDLGKTNFDVLTQSIQNLEGLDLKTLKINKKQKTISFIWKHGEVFINHESGKIRVDNGQEQSVNIIKRNYTQQVLKTVAKKYGWTISAKNKAGQEQRKFVIAKK